uniref:Uncharacterized protein n=1 Tax=Moniliophthora roreri TaxID=221103 RepID=A0A0W0FHM0_MONRR
MPLFPWLILIHPSQSTSLNSLNVLSVATHLDSTLSKSEDEVPLGAVHGVILSHRYRETITEMLNATEISNSSKVYEAAAKDEQKVADMIATVLTSEKEKEDARALKGNDAEAFMDALQQVCHNPNHRSGFANTFSDPGGK